MKIKADLHMHTKYSPDSLAEPKEVLTAALKKGLNAIAITDHDEIRGAIEAQAIAKKMKLKIQVIVGEEVATDEGDLLVYFVKKKIAPGPLEDVLAEAKRQNAICAAAHPYDFVRSGIHLEQIPSALLEKIDAVEVFNSRVSMQKMNQKAAEFCRKANKAQLAGSDAHHPSEIGNAYVVFEAKVKLGKKEMLSAPRDIFGKLSPFYVHLYSRAAVVKRKMGFK
ncbi:MAG: PHP domain-containing protein [Candidatus Micrarchaeota archaeon]|nr:PHP domain-containing protein [Candidatus Micrarchaeota archaeon]